MTHGAESLAGDAIGPVMFGTLMTALFAWRRRKDGGPAQQVALMAALKSGHLPTDADPEAWGPLLDRKRRSFRRW